MRRLLVVVALCLVGGLVGRLAFGFDIVSCGDTVPENDTGVLQADMSCGGAFVGVTVLDEGTLDMNGHAITDVGTGGSAVACQGRRCTVQGPGEIHGGLFSGVAIAARTRLTISDVTIDGVNAGIVGPGFGLPPRNMVIASNVTLTNNHNGMLFVGTIKGTNIVASNSTSGPGLDVQRRMVATNVTTNDNSASGIFGGRLRITGLTANGNGDAGVRSIKAALRDSTLTGNGGFGIGVDLATIRRPVVTNVTCNKSGMIGGSGNWGVCAND